MQGTRTSRTGLGVAVAATAMLAVGVLPAEAGFFPQTVGEWESAGSFVINDKTFTLIGTNLPDNTRLLNSSTIPGATEVFGLSGFQVAGQLHTLGFLVDIDRQSPLVFDQVFLQGEQFPENKSIAELVSTIGIGGKLREIAGAPAFVFGTFTRPTQSTNISMTIGTPAELGNSSYLFEVGFSQVPVPAALPLFATGAGVVVFMAWRQRRANATS